MGETELVPQLKMLAKWMVVHLLIILVFGHVNGLSDAFHVFLWLWFLWWKECLVYFALFVEVFMVWDFSLSADVLN